MLVHPFPPVYRADSELLILGSFPSVRSRETQFYYGHPQNRFWQVLACVYECAAPETIAGKTALLLEHRIALWDVLKSCEIAGSADAAIKCPIPNDIGHLLEQTAIRRIFCNGGKAYSIFQSQIALPQSVPVRKLPSTSPANARFTLPRLCSIWAEALRGQR